MTTNNPNLFRLRRIEKIVAEEKAGLGGNGEAVVVAALVRIGGEPGLMEALTQAGLEAEIEDVAREMGAKRGPEQARNGPEKRDFSP